MLILLYAVGINKSRGDVHNELLPEIDLYSLSLVSDQCPAIFLIKLIIC